MNNLTQYVPQDELLSFVEEKILDQQWVFLHTRDVKILLRNENICPLDDGFSLLWKDTGERLFLQPMSEDWLFCKRSYFNSIPSHSSSTPKAFVLLRLKEF